MESTSAYIDQEYRIIKQVGQGHHSDVLFAVKGTQQFAIKKYRRETADLSVLQKQLEFIRQLDHKNIIRLHEVKKEATFCKTNGTKYQCFVIILEYVEGGDFFDYIALCKRLSPEVSRTYFNMLLDALEHIHSKGIAHRDIKLQNILLDHNFVLKVTDFGFSTSTKNGRLKERLGTEGYKAPEIALRDYDGKEVDLFAAGVVLFNMYVGSPPFEKTAKTDPYYNALIEKKPHVFWSNHANYHPSVAFTQEFKDLIQHMFFENPQERYSMEQVRTHKWTTGECATLETIFEEFAEKKKVVDVAREKERVRKQQRKKDMKRGMFWG